METIHLKRNEERRVLQGHPWVFSNEIEDLPKNLPAGTLVDVQSHNSRFIGRGYFNPHSLISIRLLTRQPEEINAGFIRRRTERALALRQRLYPKEHCYRLIFSEGDDLPGLIVDRYGEYLVLQSLTAGMERLLEMVIGALLEVCRPTGIIARNDVPFRDLEGLSQEKRVLVGDYRGPIEVTRDGIIYKVDLLEDQKTGLYLDQMENYSVLKDLVQGARVLDGFCYTGGWALSAVRWGADTVEGVDSSERAVQRAQRNAALNHLDSKCTFTCGEAFDFLKKQFVEEKRYDCIILDPPAFVKRRNKLKEGLKGYYEINRRAMHLLRPGGFLVTSSCSHHLDVTTFQETLLKAAAEAKRSLRLLQSRGQARDHPILPIAQETNYLKCMVLQVL